MSSSWPNTWAAAAMDSADWLLMAAVRSKPNNPPAGSRASRTPSVRKVTTSPGWSWRRFRSIRDRRDAKGGRIRWEPSLAVWGKVTGIREGDGAVLCNAGTDAGGEPALLPGE